MIRAAGEGGAKTSRAERGGSAENSGGKRAARPVRRSRKASADSSASKENKGAVAEGKVDPDERLRQVLALLLGLGGLLLLLALVSYSRFDQANTDIRPGELTGLLTNDPDIAARADTTENWLGLLGAFFSNFLLNGTIGWFALVIPALLGYWSVVVFIGKNTAVATRTSLFTLLIAALGSALFGTIRGISWMPEIAHEWSGAVGAFIATLLGSLIGSVGATLILLSGIVIAVVYALDADIRKLAAMVGTHGGKVTEGLSKSRARWKSILTAERSDGTTEAPTTGTAAGTARTAAAAQKFDNEPARMTRRIDANDVEDARTPEPAINRPMYGRKEAPPPSPIAGEMPVEGGDNRFARPTHENGTSQGAGTNRMNGQDRQGAERPARPAAAEPTAPTVPATAPQMNGGGQGAAQVAAGAAAVGAMAGQERKGAAEAAPWEEETLQRAEAAMPAQPENAVTLTRAPLEESAPHPAEGPKLTVRVEDAETDADLETDEAGKLIERLRNEQIKYDPPPIELLTPQELHGDVDDEELKTHARLLQEKLRTFNIEIENLTVTPGPVVTLFEFVPAAGIKLSQIESLGDDIALALKARGIRIIAPIPGKGTVGVEIPNNNPAMVRIRSVLNTAKFREADMRLPLALGKTTVGEVFCDDLSKMPHLLIAGATGSGKSVGINSVLISLLYKMHPSDLKLAIIDPKKIELTQYRALIDHFLVSCPDIEEDIVTDPQNAVLLLKSLEMEMDRRYDMLAKSGQRNIFDYNKKIEDGLLKPTPEAPHVKLPFIVLIIDELADLMMTASKEVEEPIARLAQLARAIGIHIIVATQRPSVDVLTGMIKANFPARIAYQVATKVDSRTILDMNGAEQLLGNGDMLYLPGGRPKPLRLQNAFISTDEVEAICEHIGSQIGFSQPYLLPSVAEKKKQGGVGGSDERDELFDEAARLVVRHQQGSVSLVQRRLKVGYARAARIVDELEEAGIVGSFDGSKARAVLLESEAELEAYL